MLTVDLLDCGLVYSGLFLLQANIHSIVSSEDRVLQLMQLIDEAISDVCVIEEKLASYDQVIAVSEIWSDTEIKSK